MNAGLLSPVNAHSNAALNPAGAPNVRWARIGVLAKSTVAMGLPGRAGSAGYRHDGPVRAASQPDFGRTAGGLNRVATG